MSEIIEVPKDSLTTYWIARCLSCDKHILARGNWWEVNAERARHLQEALEENRGHQVRIERERR